MKKDVNERIKSVISHYGLTERAFSIRLGVPQMTINSLFKRNSVPSHTVLNAIAECFKEVSTDWLLAGRGSMLREEHPVVQVTAAPVISDSGEASVYYNMYKEEKTENKTLLEQIGQLKERLRAQEEKIEGLQQDNTLFPEGSVGSTPIRKKGAAGLGGVQFAGQE